VSVLLLCHALIFHPLFHGFFEALVRELGTFDKLILSDFTEILIKDYLGQVFCQFVAVTILAKGAVKMVSEKAAKQTMEDLSLKLTTSEGVAGQALRSIFKKGVKKGLLSTVSFLIDPLIILWSGDLDTTMESAIREFAPKDLDNKNAQPHASTAQQRTAADVCIDD